MPGVAPTAVKLSSIRPPPRKESRSECFEWVSGDPATALSAPFTTIVTESAAEKYFGEDDPIGQTLTVENQIEVKVTGVVRDLPENTHLDFDFLGALPTMREVFGEHFLDNWGSNNFHTYVLLREGADIGPIQAQSGEFFERHYGEGSSEYTDFTAIPLTDIHLRSQRENEFKPSGGMTTVYTFSAIAAFILLIACINFMNLATARSAQRAKEVGIRKVMGAFHNQLLAQFLGESFLMTLIAVVLAVALVELLLPVFSSFIGIVLRFYYLVDPTIVFGL